MSLLQRVVGWMLGEGESWANDEQRSHFDNGLLYESVPFFFVSALYL